jgi:hypothetical protein
MLRDRGHLHPVGFGEDSESILVDTTYPGIEPIPELADECEREGARKALRWVLDAVGPRRNRHENIGASFRAALGSRLNGMCR